jgi:tripartite-type tricarboxylate transporter receptor subunit TctC
MRQHALATLGAFAHRNKRRFVHGLSGLIDFIIISRSAIVPLVESGRVRMIGVTSNEPSAAYPGLQPIASVAPGFGVDLWVMVFAPAGTPTSVVQAFNREINSIAKAREVGGLIEIEGARSVESTPEQLSTRFRKEVSTWRQLATSKNVVVD